MSKIRYKFKKTNEAYFAGWDKETLDELDESMKNQIYERYALKCDVFLRDKFKCQNDGCKHKDSPITLHHTKFQKNNGKDRLRNCVAICRACHKGYHRGKASLTYNGMTYVIHKQQSLNWKKLRSENKALRKTLKKDHGIRISWKLMRILIRFLERDFSTVQWED